MKAIAIIRTSTDRQEVESQKKEVIELAKLDGYTEDNIIVIGEAGASAIKEDDKYKENLGKMKELILSDSSIKAVYAWAIDRIGRREVTLFEVKEFLIKNNVNLVIKNPSLRLFNPDGTVNSGVELAFSLFATMAKQEMEQKKERFQRAKKRLASEGRWLGGKLGYGYKVQDGFIVLHHEEAKMIRDMFNLYSTGKYSFMTLTEELNLRGYKDRLGKPLHFNYIGKLLRETRYKGYSTKNSLCKDYIAITDESTWNKCQEVRNGNLKESTKTRESKHIHYAIGLLECTECGHKYTADGIRYRCIYDDKRYRDKCHVGLGINIEGLDNILEIAIEPIHKKYIGELNKESIGEYQEKIDVLEKKIGTLRERMYDIPMKKKRVQDGYEKGIYTEKEWDEKVGRLIKEQIDLQAQIDIYSEEIDNYIATIDDLENDRGTTEVIDYGLKTDRKERMKEIIHRHTKTIHIYRVEPKDKIEMKNYGKCSIRVEIILKNGETLEYIYNTRKDLTIRLA